MKMRIRCEAAFAVLIVLVMFSYLPRMVSADYCFVYELQDHPNGSITYRLNVAVSESLQEYYSEKSHILISENDFGKFVTPYTLKPIADCLRGIYNDDEDFANGVLMVVHQITYEATRLPKYPVETIVANKGDCDLFSYIAVSILKAGNVNVVLLYYASEDHMNIGVSLPHEPNSARGAIDYVFYNNTKYYMAECTGGDWQQGWRVGECPDELKGATPQVITLENCEQSAPEQISASYGILKPSAVSLDVSSTFLIQGTKVTLSGLLSPPVENMSVTIYVKINGLPWSVLSMDNTDSSGRFTYVWVADVTGMCYLRASWSGDVDYASADSPTRTMTVLPWFLIGLLSLTAILAVIGAVAFLMARHTRLEVSEPKPPEVPS